MCLFLSVLLVRFETIISTTAPETLACRPWEIDGRGNPKLYEGKCYVHIEIEKTWYDARDFCEKHGGHLVKVTSKWEHEATLGGPEKNCYFIGLNKEQDGKWRWTDGSEVTYDKWEFSYVGWLTERLTKCAATCRHVIYCDLYKWEKKRCSSALKFICEYDAEVGQPITTTGKTSVKDGLQCPVWPTEEPVEPFLFQRKCYIKTDFRKTWYKGREFCVKHGGDLAIIESKEEDDALKGGEFCYAVGLVKKRGEDWRWVDGSPLTFSKTVKTSLDFILQFWRECGLLCSQQYCKLRSEWLLKSCTDDNYFICEYDPVPVTAPDVTPMITKAPRIMPKVVRRHRQKRLERKTGYRRVQGNPYYRLLSKPDLVVRASFSTACSRLCMERLKPCAVFNFNGRTNTCSGYSSRGVLKAETAESDDWEVWEAFEE